MRSTDLSLTEVTELLASAAPELKKERRVSLCEIEVGLFLQERVTPGAPARDAWVLFSGYPFAKAWGAVDEEGQQTLRTARYTLWTWARRRAWTDALKEYQQLDRHLRAYEIGDLDAPAVRRPSLSVAPDRWRTYQRLLDRAPEFAGQPLAFAKPGLHAFPLGRHLGTVSLPGQVPLPPRGHDLAAWPVNEGVRGLTFSGQASDCLFHAAIRNFSYSAWTSRGGR
ncbi:hypothetical protein [Streptomyces acidiscabies]|nr:hypothetical protein [Streptomyces acidiscabies]MBZ3915043.1 hypothetical protein [Streptomyces acidiscabies]MDX2967462.1 hypothetical protein [Streptomyces acidiscabies]MDX3026217.1 hypothetical protein [Streptomyces acidiscabies]MDX3797143.1 hypothetical protein [Streptomyces acidiscabies]